MQRPVPHVQNLVLIGGGHTHALVLKQWAMNPLPGASLTLITPGATAPYTGMLPAHVAGHYDRATLDIDMVRLARLAGGRIILAPAIGINLDTSQVVVDGRGPVDYDVLSVNVGVTSALPRLPGFYEFGIGAKPLQGFADKWQGVVQKASETGSAPPIAVIGGGVAGAELALSISHRLNAVTKKRPSVTLIEREDAILQNMSVRARRVMAHALTDAGVSVRCNANVTALTERGVELDDGQTIDSRFTVATSGAQPHPWLSDTGLSLDHGYIKVGPTLRAIDQEKVFAAGDCAALTHAPRPKAGVFAVRQAPVLFANLRAALGAGSMKSYIPQKRYLKIATLGGQRAVADKWGIAVTGGWPWRWKDKIDRAFMRQFSDLQPMRPPLPTGFMATGARQLLETPEPPCGGCGAKVGGDTLLPVAEPLLRQQGASSDDAARLSIGGGTYVQTIDHLRAFTHDPYVMAQISAVHALGDIWAMGATPTDVLASVTLPSLSPRLQGQMLAEIMEALNSIVTAAGGRIVGGHTSSGLELQLGLAVTGKCHDRVIAQSGAQPGDRLYLTKPIGSGVLLAGEMRALANGDDVAAAWRAMLQPSGIASGLLATAATAMTDVTGFGLAGHLTQMMRASGCSADMTLHDVPLLEGALPLSAAGVRSSLLASNQASFPIDAMGFDGDSAALDLLHDPQTAGGLLASVPDEAAPKIEQAFAAEGLSLWRIGVCGSDRVGKVRIV